MKKIFIILAAGSLIISSCKEKAPLIKLTSDPVKVDTSYVLASVPLPEPHNVLIEDFTGGTCTNCPAAHDKIVSLEEANPGRINAIALHVTDYPQAEPVPGAKYDFRTKVATDIEKNIYQQLIGMPIGGIDRMPFGSSPTAPLQCDPSIWSASTTNRLGVTDSINLSVSSLYDEVAKKAKITVTITYLQPTSLIQNINLAVVEDSFIDKQEDNRIAGYTDTAYHFDAVLRGLITSSPYGDKIAPSVDAKVKGFVYQRYYTFTWNPAWKPKNCRIIAFVTDGDAAGGKHVYQSKQTKVMP